MCFSKDLSAFLSCCSCFITGTFRLVMVSFCELITKLLTHVLLPFEYLTCEPAFTLRRVITKHTAVTLMSDHKEMDLL